MKILTVLVASQGYGPKGEGIPLHKPPRHWSVLPRPVLIGADLGLVEQPLMSEGLINAGEGSARVA